MLQNARVLVVEDEFLVAADVEEALRELGCEVVGPFPAVDEAMSFLAADTPDAAVLDVNVRGELVFPLADELLRRGVPFVFCTGYADIGVIPERLRGVTALNKPCGAGSLLGALKAKMDEGGRAAAE